MSSHRELTYDDEGANTEWRAVLGSLQVQMCNGGDYETYLADSRGTLDSDGVVVVEVRNGFVKEWIRSRVLGQLKRTVEGVYGSGVKVRLATSEGQGIASLRAIGLAGDHSEWSASDQLRHRVKLARQYAAVYPINGKMTLDAFLTSPANRSAWDAGCQVVESPGGVYNPLFFVSDTGLGKTHLCNAVAAALRAEGKIVAVLAGGRFLEDFVEAAQNSGASKLRDTYRAADALIVDGIEKLVGKGKTQVFFLDILEHHLTNGSQVVVSANSGHPVESLSPEILSRLSGGLQIRIGAPDVELNTRIVERYAEKSGIALLPDAVEYLATQLQSDVRSLVGSVARVAASVRLMPESERSGDGLVQVSGAMAAEAARDRLTAPAPRLATPEDVLRGVSEVFGVAVEALKQRARGRLALSTARDAVAYLLREECGYTSTETGVLLGGRSHSSIIEALKRYELRRDSDSSLRQSEIAVRQLLAKNRV